MSLKNSQESYTTSESEITNKETNFPEKKYCCDSDCVCERCNLQKKLMREITDEINEINEINIKNKNLSECPNELIANTVDSLLNRNCVTDFHYSERLSKGELSLLDVHVKKNKVKSAEYHSDFATENNAKVLFNDVEEESGNTRQSNDYNTDPENEGNELTTDINAENKAQEHFRDLKAKYGNTVIKYIRSETQSGQESHRGFNAKKEGRSYSCDSVGENKLRIFSNYLNEQSRDFSENYCEKISDDRFEENSVKEFSKDESEKSSLLNLKAESGGRELSINFDSGNDDVFNQTISEKSDDFSTKNVGRESPANFKAETELGSLSRDSDATASSRDLPSEEVTEKTDFAVDHTTTDAVTESKTFFVHFKAKASGREVSSGVIEGKDGKELSGDLKDGRDYSCECEESSDASTEIYDFSNIPDCRRTRRCSKRKRDIEDFCPICGVTVRCTELANHFGKEVENLSKLSKGPKKIRFDGSQGVSTTYVQVRSNRENRHAAKVSKYSRSRNEVYCPVCNFRLTGTQDEVNRHVLHCINEDGVNEEINVLDRNEFANVEYDDENSFEEYEFGDETRIRAISLVPGGYRSLHGDSSRPRRSCNDDEEGDLNVDVDDTLAYGDPQYTELDVIHNETDTGDKHDLEQLRKAVLMDPSAERHVIESRKWANDSDKNEHPDNTSSSSDKTEPNAGHIASNTIIKKEEQGSSMKKDANHIISSLKEKIKDFEEQNSSVKCLICLEPYTKPVVSTTCWHVHCEECWLMTMGVKKLCPQCNMIVFPSDLRRIYL